MYNEIVQPGHLGAAVAGIAQSVEHFTRNEGVVSSSLISGSQMAEVLFLEGIQSFFIFRIKRQKGEEDGSVTGRI